MNCTDIEKNHDRIEQYVTGALRGADRDRFEEHLLICESCQKQLEELALLRTSLADERWAVAEESRGRRLAVALVVGRGGGSSVARPRPGAVARSLGWLAIERGSRCRLHGRGASLRAGAAALGER